MKMSMHRYTLRYAFQHSLVMPAGLVVWLAVRFTLFRHLIPLGVYDAVAWPVLLLGWIIPELTYLQRFPTRVEVAEDLVHLYRFGRSRAISLSEITGARHGVTVPWYSWREKWTEVQGSCGRALFYVTPMISDYEQLVAKLDPEGKRPEKERTQVHETSRFEAWRIRVGLAMVVVIAPIFGFNVMSDSGWNPIAVVCVIAAGGALFYLTIMTLANAPVRVVVENSHLDCTYLLGNTSRVDANDIARIRDGLAVPRALYPSDAGFVLILKNGRGVQVSEAISDVKGLRSSIEQIMRKRDNA